MLKIILLSKLYNLYNALLIHIANIDALFIYRCFIYISKLYNYSYNYIIWVGWRKEPILGYVPNNDEFGS